jgi:2-phospho-L-lactate guanylyltransferase
MRWTALIPLKGGAKRKSRLAPCLSPAERAALSDRMVRHVCAVLGEVPSIGRTLLLSPQPIADIPGWHCDKGTGLNDALNDALGALGLPLLVLHADLPLLRPEDVAALLNAAEAQGIAIAPDRHGGGTNAIAIADAAAFRFAFGNASFLRHVKEAGARAAVLTLAGLSLDVDTPDDLHAAIALGFAH